MALVRKEIGDLLVDNGVITPEEWEQVRAEHNTTGDSVQEILARLGLAEEAQLKNALELQYGVNFVTLRKFEPNIRLLSLLPEKVIREYCAVPIAQEGNRLTVAMVDPSDPAGLDAIKSHLNGVAVKAVVCLEDDFLAFLRQAYVEDSEEYSAEEMDEDLPVQQQMSVAQTPAPAKVSETKKSSNSITGDWPAFTPETTIHQSSAAKEGDEEEDDDRAGDAHQPAYKMAGQTHEYGGQTSEAGSQPDSRLAEQDLLETDGEELDQTITANLRPVIEPEAQTATVAQPSTRPEVFVTRPAADRDRASREMEYVSEHDLAKRAQEEAIVLLANQILGGAIKRHCSNIHLLAGEKQAVVQYRLNGLLFVDRKLPQAILAALVARYKMMARLNLADQKNPQDGHIKVKSSSKEIVCLLSTVPTQYGENVVIWIL